MKLATRGLTQDEIGNVFDNVNNDILGSLSS